MFKYELTRTSDTVITCAIVNEAPLQHKWLKGNFPKNDFQPNLEYKRLCYPFSRVDPPWYDEMHHRGFRQSDKILPIQINKKIGEYYRAHDDLIDVNLNGWIFDQKFPIEVKNPSILDDIWNIEGNLFVRADFNTLFTNYSGVKSDGLDTTLGTNYKGLNWWRNETNSGRYESNNIGDTFGGVGDYLYAQIYYKDGIYDYSTGTYNTGNRRVKAYIDGFSINAQWKTIAAVNGKVKFQVDTKDYFDNPTDDTGPQDVTLKILYIESDEQPGGQVGINWLSDEVADSWDSEEHDYSGTGVLKNKTISTDKRWVHIAAVALNKDTSTTEDLVLFIKSKATVTQVDLLPGVFTQCTTPGIFYQYV